MPLIEHFKLAITLEFDIMSSESLGKIVDRISEKLSVPAAELSREIESGVQRFRIIEVHRNP